MHSRTRIGIWWHSVREIPFIYCCATLTPTVVRVLAGSKMYCNNDDNYYEKVNNIRSNRIRLMQMHVLLLL